MPDPPSDNGLSRRQLLRRAGGALSLVGVGVGAGFGVDAALDGSSAAGARGRYGDPAAQLRSSASRSAGPVRRYRSRPDLLAPTVSAVGGAGTGGLVLLGPGSQRSLNRGAPATGPQQGAMILDGGGELVWFHPLSGRDWATNVRVQRYRGEPVLTWWEGRVEVDTGFGFGEGVIVDSSYREVARVRAGNGRHADLHEFTLTSRDTALITCYPEVVTTDLSAIGGPADGSALGSIVQEIDVRSGRVLFEWHSLDHVPVAESYEPYSEPYDYMHVNAVQMLGDGNLLISARATWTLYKLDRASGAVIWRLGGKRSDYALGPGTRFAWQHDGQQAAPGLITVFDNGAGPAHGQTQSQSRALLLDVDEARHRVALRHAYTHRPGLLASSMGSVQILPGDRVFVGWGFAGHTSEITAAGEIVEDLALEPGHFSYRSFRADWRALPRERPTLVADRGRASGAGAILYASWNGATEVSAWHVSAGSRPDSLRPLGRAQRRGFETAVHTRLSGGYAAVTALDSSGRGLATSRTVRIP